MDFFFFMLYIASYLLTSVTSLFHFHLTIFVCKHNFLNHVAHMIIIMLWIRILFKFTYKKKTQLNEFTFASKF